jgi:magnesium-transporting ATPase (P-type)
MIQSEITAQFVNLILVIPKSIEAFICIFLVVLLTKRMMKKPPEERYLLNKLFIFAFTCWFLYIGLDAILYNLAAIPFVNMPADVILDSQVTGYPSEYPQVMIAQILRDIAMVAAFLLCYSYFTSSFLISHGTDWVKQKIFKNIPFNAIYFFIMIFLVAGDQIGVTKTGLDIFVEEKWDSMESAISMLLIIVLLLISATIFFRTVNKLESKDEIFKKRTRQIGWGVLVMGLGGVYWLIIGIYRSLPGVDLPYYIIIALIFLGHFIWMLSPILIYLGLRDQ